jgi:GDP/UDP-N,N'-diacetylbacillosamine 2-epimerase (hydrolysing)
MRKIMVFTSTRAEYGLLKPTLKMIQNSLDLRLILIVAGDHLLIQKGSTITEITDDGFEITEIVPYTLAHDSAEAISKSIGLATIDLATILRRHNPDIILLLGDRYELMSIAVCALIQRIPLAHIAGGETTQGALDEQVRHALTKMSHLHFAATREYGWRIRQMGEELWRIHVVGSPGIENIYRADYLISEEIKASYHIDPEKPTMLVTFHPETLTKEGDTKQQLKELTAALGQFPDFQQVITYPGTESGYLLIIRAWEEYASNHQNVILKKSLGSRCYLGLMRHVAVVIGNSSSGVIEAPSFGVPTVNIGDRQKGRSKAQSQIDVRCRTGEIVNGVKKALFDEQFRRGLKSVSNPYDPYGDGKVSERIVGVLKNVPLDRKMLEKSLDFPCPEEVKYFHE